MDSQWSKDVAAPTGSSSSNNGIDLSLRLGLPNNHDDPNQGLGQNVTSAPMGTNNPSFTFTGPTTDQGMWVQGENTYVGNNISANIWFSNHIFTHFSSSGFNPLGSRSASTSQLNLNLPPPSPQTANDSDAAGDSSNLNSPNHESQPSPENHEKDDNVKRCANDKCNAAWTPLWRKGPLGPKTLCNACGIKYSRKLEKKN